MAGIPTVVVTRNGFEGIVSNAFAGFGFNSEYSKGYVFPSDMFLQGSDLSPIEEHFKEFIEGGLLTWEPEMKEKGIIAPDLITISAKTYELAFEAVNNVFSRNMWRDSLPIIPPTEDKVEWILKGVPQGMNADDVIGNILPRGGVATVRSLAVALAMAGGRPEYLPTLIACMQAVVHPNMNMQSWGATTNSCFPVFIVDGPMARDIRIASGYGLAGPNPQYPAGGVIGRAVRLILTAIGGQTPGIGTMAIYGGARSENLVFAEDFEDLPEGWTSVAEEFGFKRDQNVVTITVCNSLVNVLWDFGNIEGNEHGLNAMAGCMAAPNAVKLDGPVAASLADDPHYMQGLVLLPKGFVKSLQSVSGMSKSDVQEYLWEKSKTTYEYNVDCGYEAFMQRRGLYGPGDMVPAAPKPEQILIATCGGSQSGHGYWLAPISSGLNTAIEIKKPSNWDDLLLDAEAAIGPIPATN